MKNAYNFEQQHINASAWNVIESYLTLHYFNILCERTYKSRFCD